MDDSFHIPLAGIVFGVKLTRSVPASVLITVRMFVPPALSGHELNKVFNVHSDPVDKLLAITVAESSHGGLG